MSSHLAPKRLYLHDDQAALSAELVCVASAGRTDSAGRAGLPRRAGET